MKETNSQPADAFEAARAAFFGTAKPSAKPVSGSPEFLNTMNAPAKVPVKPSTDKQEADRHPTLVTTRG